MSLLIKGMDMPKSCKDCDIKRNILGWYSCALGAKDGKPLNLENIYDELIYIDSRHPDCPLVEIPTTHGRLIDADEVKEKMLKYGFKAPDMTVTEFIEDELTTVVEEEK